MSASTLTTNDSENIIEYEVNIFKNSKNTAHTFFLLELVNLRLHANIFTVNQKKFKTSNFPLHANTLLNSANATKKNAIFSILLIIEK